MVSLLKYPACPRVVLGRNSFSTMSEHSELWTNDNTPIPILRRAPVLLGSHEEHIRAIREALALVEERQPAARDSNLRRSISHHISRVATTTLGRSLSESLRRPRGASHSRPSRVQGGEAGQVRIRKVHGKDNRTSSDQRGSIEKAIVFTVTNDGHSAHAHKLAMPSMGEIHVPALLQQGVPMTKVSGKSQKSYLFKLDADQGQIIWESKKLRISACLLVG